MLYEQIQAPAQSKRFTMSNVLPRDDDADLTSQTFTDCWGTNQKKRPSPIYKGLGRFFVSARQAPKGHRGA